MSSFAKVTIVGFSGRDCDLRYTASGKAVATLAIATNKNRKDAQGEWQSQVTWWRCTLFNQMAETANERVKKGSRVFILGTPSLNEYTDRDGNKRTSMEVDVQSIEYLDKRDDAETQSDTTPRAQAHAAAVNAQAPPKSNLRPVSKATPQDDLDDPDGGIPF